MDQGNWAPDSYTHAMTTIMEKSKQGNLYAVNLIRLSFAHKHKGNRRGAVIFIFSSVLGLFVFNACFLVLWPDVFPLPFSYWTKEKQWKTFSSLPPRLEVFFIWMCLRSAMILWFSMIDLVSFPSTSNCESWSSWHSPSWNSCPNPYVDSKKKHGVWCL